MCFWCFQITKTILKKNNKTTLRSEMCVWCFQITKKIPKINNKTTLRSEMCFRLPLPKNVSKPHYAKWNAWAHPWGASGQGLSPPAPLGLVTPVLPQHTSPIQPDTLPWFSRGAQDFDSNLGLVSKWRPTLWTWRKDLEVALEPLRAGIGVEQMFFYFAKSGGASALTFFWARTYPLDLLYFKHMAFLSFWFF